MVKYFLSSYVMYYGSVPKADGVMVTSSDTYPIRASIKLDLDKWAKRKGFEYTLIDVRTPIEVTKEQASFYTGKDL